MIIQGDCTGDYRLSIDDVGMIQAYLLGLVSLSESEFTAADVNGDGIVDVVDLSAIKFHLLGQKMLTGVYE